MTQMDEVRFLPLNILKKHRDDPYNHDVLVPIIQNLRDSGHSWQAIADELGKHKQAIILSYSKHMIDRRRFK